MLLQLERDAVKVHRRVVLVNQPRSECRLVLICRGDAQGDGNEVECLIPCVRSSVYTTHFSSLLPHPHPPFPSPPFSPLPFSPPRFSPSPPPPCSACTAASCLGSVRQSCSDRRWRTRTTSDSMFGCSDVSEGTSNVGDEVSVVIE